MTNRPIVFVDTETTCLGPQARPWEIALIRRDPAAKTETHLLVQVAYPLNGLPQGTTPEALLVGGWLRRGVRGSTWAEDTLFGDVDYSICDTEADAATLLATCFEGKPILVGVGVHFDAAILSAMFVRHGLNPEPWHYAIVDLKTATWGYLRGLTAPGFELNAQALEADGLPVRSEAIAAVLEVPPPAANERHTALGDARWAARWFDALTSVSVR